MPVKERPRLRHIRRPYRGSLTLGISWIGFVPEMMDNIARWPGKHAVIAIVFVTSAVSACSSMGDNPLTVFADPGKYRYSSCEQIAANRKVVAAKEQELQMLMDKADQGAGGVIVNLLAYKADHV